MIIGLTGGISCGKSTVSTIIKQLGINIVDADIIAHDVLENNTKIIKSVVETFGQTVIENGKLNRKEIAKIVFNNKENLLKLNKVTHPIIIEEIKLKIKEALTLHKNIILDCPLLVNTELEDICDEIWVVSIPRQEQINRLMIRNNLTEKEALERINSQISIEELIKHGNYIIDNSGSIENLKKILENKISSTL